MSLFSHFPLPISQTLADLGYNTPTQVQEQAMPAIREGRDVMAAAQTGTGKTAAFVLPLLEQILLHPQDTPSVVVLVPTRELATQVSEKAQQYATDTGVSVVALYGGVSMRPQVQRLNAGADIIVATPGRLLDHMFNKTFDPRQVKTVVLDEADRMLDLGFMDEVKRIFQRLSKERQTLCFSATYPQQVRRFAFRLLNDPVCIDVDTANQAAATVIQKAHPVNTSRKRELLSYLIGSQNLQQVLVFTKTRASTDKLAKELCLDGLEAESIHGEKSQGARERALAGFREGKIRVLVATDVAARGIDIPQLDTLFNYELPHQPEDYVHRIGRTGRAGNSGTAVTLLAPTEEGMLSAIETLIGERIPQHWLEDYAPTVEEEKEQVNKRGGRGGAKRRLKQQLLKQAQKRR
uniref:DEAD/DEAH box helicase n=1 Tax=Thaumasiovibrio occultus TaxID=1891184 RepID=UPI000B35A5E4|nr:DEAD/DEAH box helicase [Thaumasiovibrio occultus]